MQLKHPGMNVVPNTILGRAEMPDSGTAEISWQENCLEQKLLQSVFRPIQYLGNKLRTVSAISAIAADLVRPGASVVDLFTGTSVVAQSFAMSGFKVTAVDSQAYSQVMAHAMLGIDRRAGEGLPCEMILRSLDEFPSVTTLNPWKALLYDEEKAIQCGDYERLTLVYKAVPLVWRPSIDQKGSTLMGSGQALVLTNLQAGIYFGIRQSIEIDCLRLAIENSIATGTISKWAWTGLLTALMSAMSVAVHSAGKHYAQPLSAGNSTNYAFLRGRMLQDRTVSIREEFANRCERVNCQAQEFHRGHVASQGLAEEFLPNAESNFDLIYADPPYTAQQYSRFYHLLETLVSYQMPNLLHGGKVTTGLYPNIRFKSAFCSKRATPIAFQTLINSVGRRKAHLLISYSNSAAASNGNARMISLDNLLFLCKQTFGDKRVRCLPLLHKYRQFNSKSNANAGRDDAEVLIICEPK